MKLKIKQFFAKEFLILFSLLLLSGFAFVGTYLYNYALKAKVINYENALLNRVDEIESLQNQNLEILQNNSKILQQKWLFKKLEELDATNYTYYSSLWKELESLQKSDSLALKLKTMKKSKEILEDLEAIGFKSIEDFDKFIFENSLTDSELKIINENNIRTTTITDSIRVELFSIKVEISKFEDKIMDRMQQLKLAFIIFCLLGIIAYPVRFVYKAVKWSFQTLKEAE